MTDVEISRVSGPNLVLRLIVPEDAEYVYGLRTDPAYNLHLSEVEGGADDQRRWIEAYKAREASREQLYYVIERHDGVRCGLVRLYDINAESFAWGSWILDANKPRKAALESAVLSFGVGFERLGLAEALVDARFGNERALAIYRRLGMIELRRDDQNIYFRYERARFVADRAQYMAICEAEREE